MAKGPGGSTWLDPHEPRENWHKDYKPQEENPFTKSIPWPLLESLLKKKVEESREAQDNADNERTMFRAQGMIGAFKLLLNLPGMLYTESQKGES